jgi:hypothetical protein
MRPNVTIATKNVALIQFFKQSPARIRHHPRHLGLLLLAVAMMKDKTTIIGHAALGA